MAIFTPEYKDFSPICGPSHRSATRVTPAHIFIKYKKSIKKTMYYHQTHARGARARTHTEKTGRHRDRQTETGRQREAERERERKRELRNGRESKGERPLSCGEVRC